MNLSFSVITGGLIGEENDGVADGAGCLLLS
jgi:hypothetical protein